MDLFKAGHRSPFHDREEIAMLYLITCSEIDAKAMVSRQH
jgi:hypothetical protein